MYITLGWKLATKVRYAGITSHERIARSLSRDEIFNLPYPHCEILLVVAGEYETLVCEVVLGLSVAHL